MVADSLRGHTLTANDQKSHATWTGSLTLLAWYEKGQMKYAVTDITGLIQELLTEDGTLIWQARQQFWSRENGVNKDDASVCQLGFTGQYEDAESGFYYNRFRTMILRQGGI